MNLGLSILSLVILILISAISSGSETALFSLSPMKVRQFRKEGGRRRKMIASLLLKPRDLLVTIMIINIAVNILVQNVVSQIFGTFSGWVYTVCVPLCLTLIFGEVLPKSIAMANNAKISLSVAPIFFVLRKIISPIRIVVTRFAGFLSHVFFFFLKKEKEISLDELKHALKKSRDYGIVSVDEAKLIGGSLNLEEMSVKELMRPRMEILYFDINHPLSELLSTYIDKECSRVPIIDGDLENIIGIMTSDLYFLHQGKIHSSNDLRRFIREAYFVPESMMARDLFIEFHERKESIALVIDEYGLISGLISLEDIIEIVVGQIDDKRDEEHLYTRAGEDIIIASGKMEITELEELFDVSLRTSKSSMATLGGLLTEELGDIPQSGTKCVINHVLFNVLSSSNTRVLKIYIRNLKPIKSRGKHW